MLDLHAIFTLKQTDAIRGGFYMATKKPGGMTWLDTIVLKPNRSPATEAAIIRTLTKELTEALAEQNFAAIDLARCVYVIRMRGDLSLPILGVAHRSST